MIEEHEEKEEEKDAADGSRKKKRLWWCRGAAGKRGRVRALDIHAAETTQRAGKTLLQNKEQSCRSFSFAHSCNIIIIIIQDLLPLFAVSLRWQFIHSCTVAT